MSEFYATLDKNQGGPGFVTIESPTQQDAFSIVFHKFDNNWETLYRQLEAVPEYYSNNLGEIHAFCKNRSPK